MESGNEAIGVSEALGRFIADCLARKLRRETMGKYHLLAKEMKAFFGSRAIHSVSLDDLSAYREGWKLSPISCRKKIERLRTFFRFCVDRGWAKRNVALALKAPQGRPSEKVPFSHEEIEKIMWACEVYPNKGIHGAKTKKRVRAFVLLLRYSGMRISDCVTFSKGNLYGDKLRVRTLKTSTPVYLPLPESVIEALNEIDDGGERWFWSGNGLVKSAVADWQRSLSRLFKLAGVKGNPHKFRHTFATTLLQKGVPTETVARLLGHHDIRITQKHYSHWIPERQAELESAVMKAW